MAGEVFVISKSISGERLYADHVVLTYRIDYPQFAVHEMQAPIRRLNALYRRQAVELARDIQAKCYLEAVGEFILRFREGIPFQAYAFVRSFEVTYALDCIISLYLEAYCFTGGANGVTTRCADTWNTATGQRITLAELFPGDTGYPETLLTLVNAEIAARRTEDPGAYFEDAEELTAQYFSEENFYMTPEALVIFFPQSRIAPHAAGIPTFSIPYDRLFILLPTC